MSNVAFERVAPPEINTSLLPEGEREAASHLKEAMDRAFGYVQDFSDALTLFNSALWNEKFPATPDAKEIWTSWKKIAARDGAMSIFHFGKAIENMMAYVGKSPVIFSKVDRQKLKEVRKNLRTLFPNFEALRHSVAHAGELMKDPETAASHFVVGGQPGTDGRELNKRLSDIFGMSINVNAGGQVDIRNLIGGKSGRVFANTFDGKLQSYEISDDTFKGLRETLKLFYSAFQNLESPTEPSSQQPQG